MEEERGKLSLATVRQPGLWASIIDVPCTCPRHSVADVHSMAHAYTPQLIPPCQLVPVLKAPQLLSEHQGSGARTEAHLYPLKHPGLNRG